MKTVDADKLYRKIDNEIICLTYDGKECKRLILELINDMADEEEDDLEK